MENESALVVTSTDTLKMEYCPLPIVDLHQRFLYRFLEPVRTIWTEGRFSAISTLMEKGNPYERFALKAWKDILNISAGDRGILEEALGVQDKVEVYECQIVRKST